MSKVSIFCLFVFATVAVLAVEDCGTDSYCKCWLPVPVCQGTDIACTCPGSPTPEPEPTPTPEDHTDGCPEGSYCKCWLPVPVCQGHDDISCTCGDIEPTPTTSPEPSLNPSLCPIGSYCKCWQDPPVCHGTPGTLCGDSCCTSGNSWCGMDNCVDLQSDISNCGECDNECPEVTNAQPACTAGACGFECDEGYGDCANGGADGCETDLNTSADHCGACDNACDDDYANAYAVCTAGSCSFECDAGYGNCDSNDDNGCETDLNTDLDHCGACDSFCGFTCVDGECVAGKLTARNVRTLPQTTSMKCHTGYSAYEHSRIAWDGGQAIYVAMRCYEPTAGYVALSISLNGGANWANPITAPFAGLGEAADLSMNGAGLSIAANGPFVHMVAHSANGALKYVRSIDRGATWSSVVELSSGAHLNYGLDVIASGSHVFILATSDTQAPEIYISDDNGASFEPVTTLPSMSAGGKSLSVDAETGTLWLMGESFEVTSSSDQGQTWSTVATVASTDTNSYEHVAVGDHVYGTSTNGESNLISRIPKNNLAAALAQRTYYSGTILPGMNSVFVDEQGNVYIMYSTDKYNIGLRFWPVADVGTNILGAAPGSGGTQIRSSSIFDAMLGFKSDGKTGALMAGVYNGDTTTPANANGVWLEIDIFNV